MNEKSISYKDAGVDIDKSMNMLKDVKNKIKATYREEVLTDIGGFGGLFSIFKDRYKDPVLVSSIDGVGTKLKIASMMNKYDTVGVDIVAHCCNDIVVQGAEPLFFMDYIGGSNLNPESFADMLKGIINACQAEGCALIGGETAEMPGVYVEKEYDLVGSIVGIVERDKIINGSTVKAGDKVIAFESNGLHTNGYSLARKIIFDVAGYDVNDTHEDLDCTIGEALLKPHTGYSKMVLDLTAKYDIKAMAHITGGGIFDNIPRVIPDNVNVVINKGTWNMPPIFKILQKAGNLEDSESYRTFNMGLGMVLVVNAEEADQILSYLDGKAVLVGEVVEGEGKTVLK